MPATARNKMIRNTTGIYFVFLFSNVLISIPLLFLSLSASVSKDFNNMVTGRISKVKLRFTARTIGSFYYPPIGRLWEALKLIPFINNWKNNPFLPIQQELLYSSLS